jgi:hypothetical protein
MILEKIWLQIHKIDLHIAVKTGIAASCSYFIANWYTQLLDRPDNLGGGMWCVFTTIIVMQANVGSTYKAAIMRLLGIVIGSILGAFFTGYFGTTVITLGISVMLTIVICALLRLTDAYRIAALSVAVVMLSWAAYPESDPWAVGFFRSLDASIGIAIAIVISHLVWPEQTWLEIRTQFLKALQLAKRCHLQALKTVDPHEPFHEVDELFKLLARLHSDLNDTRLDFFAFEHERENWLQALQSLDRLADAIAILHTIPTASIEAICDPSLQAHIDTFCMELQETFDRLAILATITTSDQGPSKLQAQEQRFADDLDRFRNTRTTRNFTLADVELFYSFAYHLRFTAQQLALIEQQLQA